MAASALMASFLEGTSVSWTAAWAAAESWSLVVGVAQEVGTGGGACESAAVGATGATTESAAAVDGVHPIGGCCHEGQRSTARQATSSRARPRFAASSVASSLARSVTLESYAPSMVHGRASSSLARIRDRAAHRVADLEASRADAPDAKGSTACKVDVDGDIPNKVAGKAARTAASA